MSNEPLVTVNILSYNRKDELRNTLTIVYEQDYKNIEVIVVDNASTDGATEMVEEEFADVKLIKLDKNIGIAGWNKGFEEAKGEYVLVLEDDSYPGVKTINLATNCIKNDLQIGIIYLPVFNELFQKFEDEYIDKNNPNTFVGCGALLKRELIHKIGMYNDLLFLYEHEIEFSMRVYNADYKIKYCKDAVIYHRHSLSNRKIIKNSDHRRKYFISRNYLIILFLHFNLLRFLIFVPQLFLGRLLTSLIERTFIPTIRGFISGLFFLPSLFNKRLILKKEIQVFYKYGNYMGRFIIEQ